MNTLTVKDRYSHMEMICVFRLLERRITRRLLMIDFFLFNFIELPISPLSRPRFSVSLYSSYIHYSTDCRALYSDLHGPFDLGTASRSISISYEETYENFFR